MPYTTTELKSITHTDTDTDTDTGTRLVSACTHDSAVEYSIIWCPQAKRVNPSANPVPSHPIHVLYRIICLPNNHHHLLLLHLHAIQLHIQLQIQVHLQVVHRSH